MKTIYFLRSLAVIMLGFLVSNATAKEITVPGGTDADVAAALESAEDGDEIIIGDWIEFEAPVTIEKNVTFKAGGDNVGFDGLGITKIFEINPAAVEGQKLVFEGLGFVGGYNEDDGGVGRIVGGNTQFKDCYFEDNATTNRGGVFFIANDGTTVNFFNCETAGNNAGNTGGFIFTAGEVNLSFDYCHIQGNNSPNNRGGAFYLEGGYTRFFYTIISGNTSGEVGAGGEKGGAGITTAGACKAVTLESTSVVNNFAHGNHGAAFFLMGTPNITLINSVVANNVTEEGAGGWFIASDNIDITLVNTTVVNNTGTNSGNGGGGLRVMNANNRINFFNSIVLGNVCANGEGAVDVRFDDKPNIKSTFVFKNSIVGLLAGAETQQLPEAQDNANIPTKSMINMYRLADENAQSDWTNLDLSGIDRVTGIQTTTPFGLAYYSLKEGGYATKLGDPALLANYDVTTDAFLVERKVAADGSIFAGAIQAVIEDEGWKDPDVIKDNVGIQNIESVKQDIKVLGYVSNGILGLDFGELKGAAKGDLYSINGQLVENVFSRGVVGKGYYNVHVAPGVYILKVQIEGKTFAKRILVGK